MRYIEVNEKVRIQELTRFRHSICYIAPDFPDVLVVKATSGYIPKTQFQEMFDGISKIIEESKITKLVFDKSALTVFHQPSMEWYFVVWKERMFLSGLRTHRKILPMDKIFRESVKIGREKIERIFPEGKYKEMDIQYADTIEEAILN